MDASICRHEACHCRAAPSYGYCSIYCKLADEHGGAVFQHACGCHHDGCT